MRPPRNPCGPLVVVERAEAIEGALLDPGAHPPDVELREAMDATGGEGHAVVGPDGPRQAQLAEGVLEDGPRPAALDGGGPPTGEQVAGVLVADGEGIAPHAVLGGELPLEIGGPEIVGAEVTGDTTPGCRRGRRGPRESGASAGRKNAGTVSSARAADTRGSTWWAPTGRTHPTSRRCPRTALIRAVRVRRSPWRSRAPER